MEREDEWNPEYFTREFDFDWWDKLAQEKTKLLQFQRNYDYA